MEVSKEIPKEVVAKIYALYYSADCYHYEGWKAGSTERVCSNHILGAESVGVKYGQLILRSLEDITDGEIKELAKIAYNKEWVSVERQKSLIQVTSADDCTLQLYFENCGISAGDEYGNTVFIDPDVLQSVAIGDKLREWGFMLPAYGIQDLFEAGVAVRKEVRNG